MKKLFTKKDKRTNLEKEIDSVLDLMSKMKADLNEDYETNIESEINSVLEAMENVAPESESYKNMTKTLEILYKAKAEDKGKLEAYTNMTENLEKLCKARDSEKSRKISRDTMLIVGFSLLELLVMLNYEKTDVITSKAFGRLLKVRV